jgi:lipid A 3-O-deacylase
MSRIRLALLGLLLLASTASAQERAAGRSIRLLLDNDLFAVQGGFPNDHDYTHGTRIVAASAGSPRWMRALLRRPLECETRATRQQGCLASSLEIAQEIYTPRLDGATPVPGERPYSGWLYAGGSAHLVAESRVRSLRLEIGVTGPASLAEQAQDGVHKFLGERERRGWVHQLGQSVGVVVGYDERAIVARRDSGRSIGSVALEYGAMTGNLRTAVHAGLLGRIGFGRDAAWSPTDLAMSPREGVYLIGGVRQYLVARDRFVEGDADHPGAERLPMVQEVVLGIGARGRRVSFEYRHVLRGREYEAQTDAHAWGSFALTIDHL